MTLARTNSMQAAEPGPQLREGIAGFLNRRRKSIGFCLGGIACVITLHRAEFSDNCPIRSAFSAEKVNVSAKAYQLFSVSDAVPATGGYAVPPGLVSMSGTERAIKHPWIPVAAAVKADVDGP